MNKCRADGLIADIDRREEIGSLALNVDFLGEHPELRRLVLFAPREMLDDLRVGDYVRARFRLVGGDTSKEAIDPSREIVAIEARLPAQEIAAFIRRAATPQLEPVD